ncbi:hypothetical protein BGZ73_005532 [Actinomortierella ambigua]|nr:hypothetical protein BGZ73_005532 [Actinomortierella ambigua]
MKAPMDNGRRRRRGGESAQASDDGPVPSTPFGMPKGGLRRSSRLQQRVFTKIRAGNVITTPGGSSIQSFHNDDPAHALSPRRIQTDKLKRRLQFKGGVGCKIISSEAYKNLKKDEMAKDYHKEKRKLREQVVMKSRGLSLPQASRTTRRMSAAVTGQTSIAVGDATATTSQSQSSKELSPFIPRHNLRPRPMRGDKLDALLRPPNQHARIAEERRRKMYKGRRKSDVSLDFVPWKDRDENWRRQRVEKYMSSTKLAREASVFKNRKLQICGYGNPKLNLGNYLSICSEYYPELDWDKSQKLPDRRMAMLTRWNDKGDAQESGVIYYPDVVSDPKRPHIRGFCFTVQSELALQYEQAQRVVFSHASNLVNFCFQQYHMDLSLDASLDDGFTVDMFLSNELGENGVDVNVVHAVTQFIFMRSYIYVDKICVSHHMLRLGIGSFMMERIVELAEKRGKDILLYALGPVVPVYRRWGFRECKEWPVQEEDFGIIMRKRVATKNVVDDYDCGMVWNGAGFSRVDASKNQAQSQSQNQSQAQTPSESQTQSQSQLSQAQSESPDPNQSPSSSQSPDLSQYGSQSQCYSESQSQSYSQDLNEAQDQEQDQSQSQQ